MHVHVHAIIYLSVPFVPVNQSINQSIKNNLSGAKLSKTFGMLSPYCVWNDYGNMANREGCSFLHMQLCNKHPTKTLPFNCMSFSPICKLPSVPIESPQHRNESLTASTVQKSTRKNCTVLTSSSVPKKPQAFKTNAALFWIESLHLLMSDYDVLLNGSWVTDNIVNAGQIIIKDTFPHICGLQNILLGMNLQFDVQAT